MLKKFFQAGLLLMVVGLFGGCASTNYLSVNDLTDQALNKIICSAEPDEPKRNTCNQTGVTNKSARLLRSKLVAAIIGHYAANRINKYSGPRKEDDAVRVLSHLKKLKISLNQKKTALSTPSKPQMYWHSEMWYREKVGKLVEAAVRPARRHYEEQFWSALGTGFTVAAAKNAGKAILALLELKAYKQAIAKDMYDKLKDNATSSEEWTMADNYYDFACSRVAAFIDPVPNPSC